MKDLQALSTHIGSGEGRVVVDLDDTLVENAWPELGDWKPGALDFLRGQLEQGRVVVIYSTRFAPTQEDEETLRPADEVEAEIERVRQRLDTAGLGEVELWDRSWKPGGIAYVDDKAVAARGDWNAVERKIDALSKGLPNRHPSSARFHELVEEIADLHDMKQADYGVGHDPFANVRASQDWGISGWVGAMVRLTDKVRRLMSLARKKHLVNEAALDSFKDIAVYALIACVLFEEDVSNA